jgi:hypothetical protein
LGWNLLWTALSARGLKYPAVYVLLLDSEISKAHYRSLSELEKSPLVKMVELGLAKLAGGHYSLEFSGEESRQFATWDQEYGHLQLLKG